MKSRCRSCKAEIVWATSDAGRAMPFDGEPSPAGTYFLVPDPRGFKAPVAVHEKSATPTQVAAANALKHTSHFGTCPQSKSWSRR